jgi:hypothetical protein
MVADMKTNIDHDIFRKKSESRRLDIQVRWWLRKQKKEQPEQIEIGRSLYVEQCQAKGIQPFKFTLRDAMTASVEQAHAEKESVPKGRKTKVETVFTPDTSSDESRILFNRNARKKAFDAGLKKFQGRCKNHGEQVFSIRKNGNDHLCIMCQRKFSTAQNEKRKKLKQVAA